MEGSTQEDIELYPIFSHEKFISLVDSIDTISVRGTNYNKKALFFTDTENNKWVWKKLSPRVLLTEYIISLLAQFLEIPIPQSILSKIGHCYGLLQFWIEGGEELQKSKNRIETKLKELIVFEAWIGALDRHGANYLVTSDQIWAIDYEDSFSTKTMGSELLLYYPWLGEMDFESEVRKIQSEIDKKKLISLKNKILKEFPLPLDSRARIALMKFVDEIFTFLLKNRQHLSILVEEYLYYNSKSNYIFNFKQKFR